MAHSQHTIQGGGLNRKFSFGGRSMAFAACGTLSPRHELYCNKLRHHTPLHLPRTLLPYLQLPRTLLPYLHLPRTLLPYPPSGLLTQLNQRLMCAMHYPWPPLLGTGQAAGRTGRLFWRHLDGMKRNQRRPPPPIFQFWDASPCNQSIGRPSSRPNTT